MSTKVSESTGYVPNIQMSVFGYVMAGILVIVMLPVLPIVAIAWVLWRAFVSEERLEPSFETWRNDPNRSRPQAPPGPEEAEEESEAEEAEAEA